MNRIILVVDMLSGALCALAGLATLVIGVAVLNGSMSLLPMSILSAPVDQFTAGLMLTAAGFVAAGSSIGMCARSLLAHRRVMSAHWCDLADDLDASAHRLARVVHALDTGTVVELDDEAAAELSELRRSYDYADSTAELDRLRAIASRLATDGPPLDHVAGRARCRLCGATTRLPATAEHIGDPPVLVDWAGIDMTADWHYSACAWRQARNETSLSEVAR